MPDSYSDSYPTHTRPIPWRGLDQGTELAGPTWYHEVVSHLCVYIYPSEHIVARRLAVSAQRHCCVAAMPPQGGGTRGAKQDREDIAQAWLQRDGINEELRREFEFGVGARLGELFRRFRHVALESVRQSSRRQGSQPCWLQVASGKLPRRCLQLRQRAL